MSKKNLLLLFLALIVPGLISAAGTAAPLPPALVGYLRVENPDRMIAGLEEFLQGLDVPPLAGAAVKMGLGAAIENPGLSGIDLSGPVVLASFQPDQAESWALSLTLSSPEAYQRALIKNWELQTSEEESGIKVYRRQFREFDSEAFQAASPEEQKEVDSFYRTGEKTLAVAWKENRAWISPQPEVLREVAALSPADFPSPVAGGLVAFLPVSPLLEIAEAGLRERMIAPPPASGDVSPLGPETVRAQALAGLELYLHFARQVDNFISGLTLDGSGIRLQEMIQPRPGTGLAKFLSAQQEGKLSLARFLEPSPWLAVSARLEDPQMLTDVYARIFDVFSRTLAETGETAADEKAVRQLDALWRSYIPLMDDYLTKCAGDEMAFSISSAPGCFFSGVSIQKIRSREAYRDYIKNSFLSNRELLTPVYEGMGISVDDSGIENPQTYQKTEIYTVRMTFDWKKLFRRQTISAEQNKIFALLDAPFVMQMAASGDLAVTEISWGGEPDIKARLEQIAAEKSSFDTARLGPSWASANGVIYFSLNRYLSDFLGPMIERAETGEDVRETVEIIQALGKLDLPLVIYLTVEGSNLKADLAIPMERIQAVKTAIEEVQAGSRQPEEPRKK